eukprot:358842-Chlamydomonas_euryale.AAC.3
MACVSIGQSRANPPMHPFALTVPPRAPAAVALGAFGVLYSRRVRVWGGVARIVFGRGGQARRGLGPNHRRVANMSGTPPGQKPRRGGAGHPKPQAANSSLPGDFPTAQPRCD